MKYQVTVTSQIKPYITKDGSEIRELMHPALHMNKKQSLAEATIKPDMATAWHKHKKSEELYYVLDGSGLVGLGKQLFEVRQGMTIFIPSGVMHCIKNNGQGDLKILC